MNKLNGLDKTLIFIAILDTLFVISMIIIFCLYGSVPDTLIIAVFGATFGECGCCSYIWKTKKEKEISNGGFDYKDCNHYNNDISNIISDSLSENES